MWSQLSLAHRTRTEDGVQVGRTENCTILSSGQSGQSDFHDIAKGCVLKRKGAIGEATLIRQCSCDASGTNNFVTCAKACDGVDVAAGNRSNGKGRIACGGIGCASTCDSYVAGVIGLSCCKEIGVCCPVARPTDHGTAEGVACHVNRTVGTGGESMCLVVGTRP